MTFTEAQVCMDAELRLARFFDVCRKHGIGGWCPHAPFDAGPEDLDEMLDGLVGKPYFDPEMDFDRVCLMVGCVWDYECMTTE